jgi:hypothetical protein
MFEMFFREGGFAMYPIAISGFLLVASSLLLALRPTRRLLRVVVSLGAFTIFTGMLGTVMGIGLSFHYLGKVPVADQLRIGALGVAESLNNTMLALFLVLIASLLSVVAAVRAWRADARALQTQAQRGE